MRTHFKYLLVLTLLLSSILRAENPISKTGNFYFTENKGQIGDQNYKPRPDVLFAATDGQLVFHLKNTGISYQQYRVDKWGEEPDFSFPILKNGKSKMRKVPTQQTIYRLDVEWLNCNTNCVIERSMQKDGYENYYNANSPNGALEVSSYQQLIYKEIYSGIDLKWYQKDGHLKYDYIVSPGANYKNIQLNYSGADKLTINKKGELIITTPLGEIVEQTPIVTQNNKVLKSAWQINKNTVSFSIENYNSSLPLIIDPGVRIWGTYYGGSSTEAALRSVIDAVGNVYTTGNTSSNAANVIATVGSHQSVYGGGADNGYLVKFNSAGVRQWATYYGGPVREFGISVALDASGSNVYMCGHSLSNSPNVVATPGAHQTANAGGFDAFLVKFNSAGVRQWGTYYGDTGLDYGMSCATDATGNVYLAGNCNTSTGTVIATAASHQPVFGGVEDAFLVQFNSNGVRQWATHYGGTGLDNAYFCTTDATGNIYMSGFSDCSVANIIATPGAFQTVNGGGALDAYVVKFNTNGVRQVATLYGGSGEDRGYGCAVDLNSNDIYLTGETSSPNAISSPSCNQTSNSGGAFDAFLVRFDNNMHRKWGTFYGSSAEDVGYGCYVHITGHVYIAGYTTGATTTLIATPGSFQSNFGGGSYDAFIAQFDTAGVRTWGSYYGDTGDDLAYTCTSDNVYDVFLTGVSTSTTGTTIATVGSHQPTFGGGFGDGMVIKFYDCPPPLPPTNITSTTSLNFCSGSSSTLMVNSGGVINWYASPTSTTSLGTGTTYITPVLSSGITTYYAEASTCTVSVRTAISITVNPTPSLTIIASPTLVCAGKSTTLNVSGATTYTWDNAVTTNTNAQTPTITTIYSVIGTSSLGCDGTQTISITVYPPDPVTLIPSTAVSCLSIFGGGPVILTGSPPGGVYSGPNVSGNTLNPTALGTFNPVYTYTNSTNGCVNSATASILVISCLGVKEEHDNLNSVLIYPNPTKGAVTIETNSDLEKTISITDVSGKILKTEITKNKIHIINISDYANGVYFIKIKSALGNKEYKLIKE